MPSLSVHHLSLSIGGQEILKDVSCTIQSGEVVGLIGPNGSGKTTLFNILSGFLSPTKGTVHFRGSDITHLSPAERARVGIGRVFQNIGIFREMTLEENVLVALEALPSVDRAALGDLHDVVRKTLKRVHLDRHATALASSLSGGQLRLLEIARTFAAKKDLFLLDEPTAGVSPKMTHDVAELILSLKEAKKTVLIVEHDLPFIHRICDRILLLDVGEIVVQGTPEEVKRHPKFREIYLGE